MEVLHRISLILNNSDNLYWQRFKKGAMDAALEKSIAIEFHGIEDPEDVVSAGRQMRIAVASQKDGVIINTLDEASYESDMAYLAENGVLVLTTGVEAGKNSYFVGTNTFEFGQRAAQLVIQAAGENARVAVILDSTTDEMVGFSKEIQQYKGATLETIKKTDGHLIGAVDVIHSILTDYPQVNVIFCMTPEDTLAAAQAIVDRNLVGDIIVVGTDLSDTLIVRRYIERNIIFGYIERNPYDAGFQSVAVLAGVLRGEFKPTYVTVDLDTVTKWDMGQYRR
jgi:ribose transport system substrate-binding protein